MKKIMLYFCVCAVALPSFGQTSSRQLGKMSSGQSGVQGSSRTQPVRVVRAAPEVIPYDDYGYPNPDAFDWTGFSLGAGIGTLGLNGEAAYHLTEWLNIKGNGHLMTLTYKDTIDSVDYTFDAEFSGFGLLLDLYPGQTRSFRFSGGLMFQDHAIPVKGDPRGNYPADTQITGEAKFDSTAPYFGIGFGNPVKPDSALTLTFDIGVILQDYSFDLKAEGTGANDPAVQSAIASTKADVENVLDYFTIYPVITLGFNYHF